MENSQMILEDSGAEASKAAGKIGETLVKKIVSGTAGEILGVFGGGVGALLVGALIDNFIDPPSEQQIINYKLINDMVKKDISDDHIGTISGYVHGAANQLFSVYAPYREKIDMNKVTAAQLIGLNKDLNTALDQMTGHSALTQLSDPTHLGPIGIPVYMYGVVLEMAIYQEFSNLWTKFQNNYMTDGNYNSKDLTIATAYNDLNIYTAYADPKTGTISRTISDYCNALEKNWEQAIKNRLNEVQVSVSPENVVEVKVTDTGNTKLVLPKSLNDTPANILDNEDILRGTYYARGENFCNTYYFPKIINDLCIEFGYPDATHDQWSVLIDSPMGLEFKADVFNTKGVLEPQKLQDQFGSKRKDFYLMETGGITSLQPTQRLYSVNRAFYLELRTDGSLAIYNRKSKTVHWQTAPSDANLLSLTEAGALELTNGTEVVWSTNTTGDNYVFLQNNGMLQVKGAGIFDEQHKPQVKWCSNLGIMPASFNVDTNFGATTYHEFAQFQGEIGVLTFKGNGNNTLNTSASLDGYNWLAPTQPEYATNLQSGPFALAYIDTKPDGYGSSIAAVYQSEDHNICLTLCHPYVRGFEDTYTLNHNVGTTITPSATAGKGFIDVLYKGSLQNNNIYQWQWTDMPMVEGKMTTITENATKNTPQFILFKDLPLLVYTALEGNGIYYKYFTGETTLIPNDVLTLDAPALTICNGLLYVIYRGVGVNKVWYITWDGKTWGHPIALFEDTLRTDAAPAAFTLNHQVFVFVKGAGTNDMYCAVI